MSTLPKVITHPLGFAGYALACVFGLIARFGPSTQYPWLVPVAVGFAALSLVAGLALAFRQTSHSAPRPKTAAGSAGTPTLHVETTGDNSPAIANTRGDLTINYGNKGK
jgi:hypothetical protein